RGGGAGGGGGGGGKAGGGGGGLAGKGWGIGKRRHSLPEHEWWALAGSNRGPPARRTETVHFFRLLRVAVSDYSRAVDNRRNSTVDAPSSTVFWVGCPKRSQRSRLQVSLSVGPCGTVSRVVALD